MSHWTNQALSIYPTVTQETLKMEDYQISRKEGPLASFQKQLASLALSKEFTDVTLVCKDLKPMGLHRVVLSAASLWFRFVYTIYNYKCYPKVHLE